MEQEKASIISHYLGEHQQQAFFGHVRIKLNAENQWQTYKIGSCVPFCMHETFNDEKSTCLAMILHIFKRFTTPSLSVRSESKTSATPANTGSFNSNGGSNVIVQDLITLKIFFHVSNMKSVYQPKLSADNRKRIYSQPHNNEFVVHPTQITIPLNDFIDRVKRGIKQIDHLNNYSSKIPQSLIKLSKDFQDSHSYPRNSDKTKDVTNEDSLPQFLIFHENLYNRIKTIERLQSEGIHQMKRPIFGWSCKIKDYTENDINCERILETIDKSQELFYTGLCQIRPQISASRINREEEDDRDELSNNSSINEKLLLTECKSPLQHIQRNILGTWPLSNDTRMVFIRRQSNEFILSTTKSPLCTPAKIRRTRVRGTDQMAIKLKRPIFIPDNFEDPLIQSLISEGVFEQIDSYSQSSRSDSPLPLRSSKRVVSSSLTGNACQISYAEINTTFSTAPSINNNSTCMKLHHSHSDSNLASSYDENQRSLRANPPVSRRINYIDRDLEIALQRSLTEKNNMRKRKSNFSRSSNQIQTLANDRKKAQTRTSRKSLKNPTRRGRPRKMAMSKSSSQDNSPNEEKSRESTDNEEEDMINNSNDELVNSNEIKYETNEKIDNDQAFMNENETEVKSESEIDNLFANDADMKEKMSDLENSASTLNESNEDAKTEPQTCSEEQVQMMYTNVHEEDKKDHFVLKEEGNETSSCKKLPEFYPPLSGIVKVPPPLDNPPGFLVPPTMWTLRKYPLPAPLEQSQTKKTASGLPSASQQKVITNLQAPSILQLNNQQFISFNQNAGYQLSFPNNILNRQSPTSSHMLSRGNGQKIGVPQNLILFNGPPHQASQNQNILSLQTSPMQMNKLDCFTPVVNTPGLLQSLNFQIPPQTMNFVLNTNPVKMSYPML